MGNKESDINQGLPVKSTPPSSFEEEVRQWAKDHPGTKVTFDNMPLQPKTGVMPTVVHGTDQKGREVTFVCGPSHFGGLDPHSALELAVEFDETARSLPSSSLRTAYISRAEVLLDHAAHEELRRRRP